MPDRIVLVDQSGREGWSAVPPGVSVDVVFLEEKRGCEASAINYYLTEVPEDRIIAHDDVVFGPESIAQFVATPGDFVIDASQGVLTYRDACVEAVGLYDTTLSPNYFRYVDVDYEDRLALAGIEPVVVDCGIRHERDGTMRGMADLTEYHRRVGLAHDNYVAKWGRDLTPGGSTIGRSNWRKTEAYTRGHRA
ncbi:MAG TPA: hypothetical protein VN903_30930 [Polyangia bacterium]|nr:hypothetical protein [Polyangia bacterium]